MSKQTPSLGLEQLKHILSFSKTATAIHVGEAAVIEFANDAMLAIWGKGREVMGKSLADALPELQGQPFIEMFAKVWREGITISGKDTPADLSVDGKVSTFYFDFEYRAVKDESGTVIGILHSATDITERFLNKQKLEDAELNKELLMREQSLNEELAASNEELNAINEELSSSREELSRMNLGLERMVEERVNAFIESEERFRTMAENTDVLISVGDEQGKKFYFNRAWVELSGRSSEELINRGWNDLIHEEDRDEFLQIHQHAFSKRVSYTDEFRILGADGEYHWLLKKGTPRFLSDGTFTGYISSCIDITQKKIDERRLQEVNEELAASNEELATTNEELAASYDELFFSEARFRNLIKQAPVAICVIRAEDLLITDVNDGYLELVGKERIQLEEQTIWDAVPEAADTYAPLMQQVIDSGIAFHGREHELILVRNGKDENVFVDFVYEPVTDLQGNVSSIMVVGNEVTDKVLARRKIEDAEIRVRLAIEAAEIGTYEFNYADGKLTASERFYQIFGSDVPLSRDEIIATYHPEDMELSNVAHELAEKTGKLFYESRLVIGDGTLRWVRIQGNVFYDAVGNRTKLLGTVLDITEYKRLQQQKDDFISIASHELKTPITSLKASLQLLERMKANPTQLLPRLIEQSTKSMQKISELVDDLLNVSRMKEGQVMLNTETFRIVKLLDECCAPVREMAAHELIVTGDPNLAVVGDQHRIEQVVVNFVNNAVKYAPESKEIFLNAEDLGENIRVTVRDNGPGIPAEKLPHLFERYFRADESGAQVSGLGLGLYISADIIARHGGKIGVESEEGKGSTFWFTLPKAT
ncbi:MAG: PAS domain S-box protein [Pedobacter sp.]|nr:PAS domain S-box protein [Pedobacter sp.]MDQ8053158.1 PAS domain S-box protein [Pedobacter sp.]